VKMLQPKTILEIGTLHGYSWVFVWSRLAKNGKTNHSKIFNDELENLGPRLFLIKVGV